MSPVIVSVQEGKGSWLAEEGKGTHRNTHTSAILVPEDPHHIGMGQLLQDAKLIRSSLPVHPVHDDRLHRHDAALGRGALVHLCKGTAPDLTVLLDLHPCETYACGVPSRAPPQPLAMKGLPQAEHAAQRQHVPVGCVLVYLYQHGWR